jgi:hypothetical protein
MISFDCQLNLLILEEENTIKPDKKLTLGAIKEAKQEYNKRVQQIQVQIKERTKERKAIGGMFKMITIYADEIQNFRNFDKENDFYKSKSIQVIKNLISNKIKNEFLNIENTSTKYGLNVFMYITCLMYKDVPDEEITLYNSFNNINEKNFKILPYLYQFIYNKKQFTTCGETTLLNILNYCLIKSNGTFNTNKIL